MFSTHYQGFAGNKKFIFDRKKYLLIDLAETKNEKETFKLLNLYSDEIKDIKLIKY